MTEIFSLVEYGMLGLSFFLVIVICYIVVKFLDFLKHQEVSFKNTIDNHLNCQAKLNQEQMEMNKRLKDAICELMNFLKYHNEKK